MHIGIKTTKFPVNVISKCISSFPLLLVQFTKKKTNILKAIKSVGNRLELTGK